MQGFKDLLKRPDLLKDYKEKNQDQIKSSKPEDTKLQEILTRLKAKQAEGANENLQLVVDNSKSDLGTLIKLNSLKKRVHFINHVLGGWKPS